MGKSTHRRVSRFSRHNVAGNRLTLPRNHLASSATGGASAVSGGIFCILFAAVGKKHAVGDKKDDGPPVAKRKSPLLRAKEQKAVEPSHRAAPLPKKQNEKSSVRLHRAFNHQIARVTLPERRHRVQTYTWRGVPLITALTRLTLGFQGRLERRWE